MMGCFSHYVASEPNPLITGFITATIHHAKTVPAQYRKAETGQNNDFELQRLIMALTAFIAASPCPVTVTRAELSVCALCEILLLHRCFANDQQHVNADIGSHLTVTESGRAGRLESDDKEGRTKELFYPCLFLDETAGGGQFVMIDAE